MAVTNSTSWLTKLDEQLNVDVDWVDAKYIQAMPQRLGLKPHDSTSNQLWVDTELYNDANTDLVVETARSLKDKGWLHIYTRVSVLLCKRNINNIQGRVLLQTSPAKAYDEQATIEHARLLDQEFKLAGIDRSRYCIKIPSTGPALNAAKVLAQDKDESGLPIATLGTAIFGLPQAIAASQASMLYISPYLNEIAAHNDLSLWPNVEDPATQHPMSARIVQIMDTYRRLYQETGKPQPKVKLASFISAKEAMAAGEWGCHSATLSPKMLDELAKLDYDGGAQPVAGGVPKPAPDVEFYQVKGSLSDRLRELATTDPLAAAAEWDGKLASTEVDYLADGGKELDSVIEEDNITKTRLAASLEMFKDAEIKSRAKIEAILSTL
ncbi:unnamed protein product [Discula destructiva]